jgi:hypothetical protein
MASCESAFARCGGFIPQSRIESNAMTSWREIVGVVVDVRIALGKFLILLLMDDSRITPEACSKTMVNK